MKGLIPSRIWLLGIVLLAHASVTPSGDNLYDQSNGIRQRQPHVSPLTSFGDSIWSFYFNGDQGLYGVEFDGECFYLTGANHMGDSNMVYVFDRLGNYLREFGQKNSHSDWGWWDLAYRSDKDYFFGSDDSMITAFDRFGNILHEFRGPYSVNTELAWDGEHLWVGFDSLPIVKTDIEGNVVATYPNPYNVQGLAFSCGWDSTRAVLFELCQLVPDHVVAYDMGPIEITLSATVDIKPEVLNLKSRGRWVTCYIELSEGYGPEEIDRSTVAIAKIDEQVLSPPVLTEGPSDIGDYDGDGIPDLMVKFNRQELIAHLQGKYGVVTILVSGELYNGVEFEGSDTLRVIEPPQSNRNPMVEGNTSAYAFQLCQNTPSPFSTSTRISYQLPEALPVRLAVYDVRGRLVRTLLAETQSPGPYMVEWRGDNDSGNPVPAGVYLYRLDAGPLSATRKTVLLR